MTVLKILHHFNFTRVLVSLPLIRNDLFGQSLMHFLVSAVSEAAGELAQSTLSSLLRAAFRSLLLLRSHCRCCRCLAEEGWRAALARAGAAASRRQHTALPLRWDRSSEAEPGCGTGGSARVRLYFAMALVMGKRQIHEITGKKCICLETSRMQEK